MSFRLKTLLIAIQVSILMWCAIIYGGAALMSSFNVDTDEFYTASIR